MSTIKSSTSKHAEKQQKPQKSEKGGGGGEKKEAEIISTDDLKVELKGTPDTGIDKMDSEEAGEAGDKNEDKGKKDASKKKVKSGVAGLV
jgi:hypothetical protein